MHRDTHTHSAAPPTSHPLCFPWASAELAFSLSSAREAIPWLPLNVRKSLEWWHALTCFAWHFCASQMHSLSLGGSGSRPSARCWVTLLALPVPGRFASRHSRPVKARALRPISLITLSSLSSCVSSYYLKNLPFPVFLWTFTGSMIMFMTSN